MLHPDRAESQPCYTETARPKWRNGRRAGLKNRWENIPCRFESDLRHQLPLFLLKNGSKWGRFVIGDGVLQFLACFSSWRASWMAFLSPLTVASPQHHPVEAR